MFSKEKIDYEFINILEKKINKYKETEPIIYRQVININTLLNIGKYINNLKPKSKYREHKHQILKFIDIIENEHGLTKREVVALVNKYLSGTFTFLQSEHSFSIKNDWLWSGVFNLTLDIFLIIIGIAKYYYYIPIFTITAVVKNVRKQKKAKETGRYIDF